MDDIVEPGMDSAQGAGDPEQQDAPVGAAGATPGAKRGGSKAKPVVMVAGVAFVVIAGAVGWQWLSMRHARLRAQVATSGLALRSQAPLQSAQAMQPGNVHPAFNGAAPQQFAGAQGGMTGVNPGAAGAQPGAQPGAQAGFQQPQVQQSPAYPQRPQLMGQPTGQMGQTVGQAGQPGQPGQPGAPGIPAQGAAPGAIQVPGGVAAQNVQSPTPVAQPGQGFQQGFRPGQAQGFQRPYVQGASPAAAMHPPQTASEHPLNAAPGLEGLETARGRRAQAAAPSTLSGMGNAGNAGNADLAARLDQIDHRLAVMGRQIHSLDVRVDRQSARRWQSSAVVGRSSAAGDVRLGAVTGDAALVEVDGVWKTVRRGDTIAGVGRVAKVDMNGVMLQGGRWIKP